MSYPRNAIVIGAVAACSFLVGLSFKGRVDHPQASSAAARGIVHYACPMHPQYQSDHPGDCPSCGMRLEPVNSEGRASEGALRVSTGRQQLIGVQTALVRRTGASQVIRTPGRVIPDERLIYRVNASFDGWVTQVYSDTTGSLVKKDQRLATLYSTMYRGALQSYLITLNHLDTAKEGLKESPSQIAAVERSVALARDGLRNLGMGEPQIEEIARTKAETTNLHLYSPAAGLVLSRNISVGQRVTNGEKLYEIVNIDHVWVVADLFEQESRYVRAGQSVEVTYQGREFPARVSEVLPQFDEESRTLKVRLEMANPDYTLRPGMFVDVELPLILPAAVVVPVDAVIDSGFKKTVFVAKGDGYFEPRMIETGWRIGGQVEIVKGLSPGEQIVVSGNFLLDSESRMRMTAGQGDGETRGHGDMGIDPVCGMDVSPAKAAGKSEYKGKTYYFCSDYCKREFDKNPTAVLSKKAS